jgi:hypothetical protein
MPRPSDLPHARSIEEEMRDYAAEIAENFAHLGEHEANEQVEAHVESAYPDAPQELINKIIDMPDCVGWR